MGFSPFYLLFGRNPRLIGDCVLNIKFENSRTQTVGNLLSNLERSYNVCRNRLKMQHIKSKAFYDKAHAKNIVNLEKGDIVLLRNYNMATKIDNRWCDTPYMVIDKPDENIPVYKIKNTVDDSIKSRHRNQLLPIYKSSNTVEIPKKRLVKRRIKSTCASNYESTVLNTQNDLQDCNDSEQFVYGNVHVESSGVDSDSSNTSETEVESSLSSSSLTDTHSSSSNTSEPELKRSDRNRRPPDRYNPADYD